MSLHKEVVFENEIVEHLAAHGWIHEPDTDGYDKTRALYPADVIAWVKDAQPAAWEKLTKNHGASAQSVLIDRLRDQMNQRGTLDVLRQGLDVLGLNAPLKFAEFKPAHALNPDIVARYEKNRVRVVRQVRYSLHSENSIDLVLFLNGIPIATVELKSDFTQAVENAIDQYRFDRIPNPKGKTAEPLLTFPSGALVHFAVSNSEVYMTTRLQGPSTTFLPFNQGDGGAGHDGGAGNPVNKNGHRTAYLWERIWERESWLEIIGRYFVTTRDEKKQIKGITFPRFHQLDVTRKLRAAALKDGPGARYLVQHSAGSGKTKSIAWTAHFLSDLHDEKNNKVFDTVVVVSDRTVIDGQLRDAIFDIERNIGVVASIDNESSSKSAALAEALSTTKKIVVCTIQTFPFALKAVQDLAATMGKKFVVIADEAHSSQAGDAAAKLKAVLSPEELSVLNDGGEVSTEDLLAAQMTARADAKGITFIAFTATPKGKTLELFGDLPDPTRKPAADNIPRPFHVYSMRQAIEEGFILDVLKNYTSYELAFKLAQEGAVEDKEVEKSTAKKKIMGWVQLHPYNIAEKVKVVVEHFRENVAPLLDKKAKAMVVVSSRIEAVRWKLAIEKYIKEKNYAIGTLVAFSGEVIDPTSHDEPLTENSTLLNPTLKKRDIKIAFDTPDYQVLLVANKFQTGFDQPLLCGMYVDKRLDGIQAVQTLSRLNRAHPGKDTTFVLDFRNKPADILAAFKTYYGTATLETTTDPNLVFSLRAKLDAAGHYDDFEVDAVVEAVMGLAKTQAGLGKVLEPVVDRLLKKHKAARLKLTAARQSGDKEAATAAQNELDALQLFKSDVTAFIRLYTFLSQIFDYGSTAVEKRAIFFRHLLPLLEFGRERDTIDLSKLKLTHHALKQKGNQQLNLDPGLSPKLKPVTESGSGSIQEKEKAHLAEIIEKVNGLFDGVLTDDDKLVYVSNVVFTKMLESEALQVQAENNTAQQFSASPDLLTELQDAVMASHDAHQTMSSQLLNDPEKMKDVLSILLELGLQKALKERLSKHAPTGP
jgi:type I restriction enzyme R subunit